MASTPRARLTARIPMETREIIERAAEILGGNINQFLVDAAVEKAYKVIEMSEKIHLTRRDAEVFFAALEAPAEPHAALRAAVAAYKDSPLFAEDREVNNVA